MDRSKKVSRLSMLLIGTGIFGSIIPWTVTIFGIWTQIVHQSMLIYKQMKGWFPFKKYKAEQSTCGLEKYKTWFTIQYWMNHWYYIGLITFLLSLTLTDTTIAGLHVVLFFLLCAVNMITYYFLTKPYIEEILTDQKIATLSNIDAKNCKQLRWNTKHYSKRILIYGFWGIVTSIILIIGLRIE